jgi:hypothetical protein
MILDAAARLEDLTALHAACEFDRYLLSSTRSCTTPLQDDGPITRRRDNRRGEDGAMNKRMEQIDFGGSL